MIKLLYIAFGGATGTLLRYWISGYTFKSLGQGFPWGTMAVNLIGAFFIGIAWGLSEKINIPPHTRAMIFVGLFGGFTTFSTFAYESFSLIKSDQLKNALTYILVSNLSGVILVYAGIVLGSFLVGSLK